MRPKARGFVLAVILLALQPRDGQCLQPGRDISQYVAQTWGVEQGLPQSTVYAVTQSLDGHLWAATQEGFVRFDGVQFLTYDKATHPSIRNHFALTLLAARDGSLLVGTDGGGLIRLHRDQIQVYTTADGLPHNSVSALHEAADGSVWIGTQNGVARRTNGGRITTIPLHGQLPHSTVTALVEDWSGRLWIGTMAGLASYRGGVVTRHENEGFPQMQILALSTSRDGSVWIGTRGGGLHRFRGSRFRLYGPNDGLNSNDVAALLEDRQGTIWVGTMGSGLGRFAQERFQFQSESSAIADISALFEDREGNIWIGGAQGLTRLADGRVVTFAKAQGLAGENIRSLHAGPDGTVLVASGGGLQSLRSTDAAVADERIKERALSVLTAHDGRRWIGTFDRGLLMIDGHRRELFDEKRGLLSNTVLALYEDKQGTIWAGTANGLQPISAERVGPAVVSGHAVSAIYQDRSGAIWAGTQDNGARRIGEGRVMAFTTVSGLQSDFISAFHEDHSGALWVGTVGGGLHRLKNGRWGAVTTRQGLYDDSILAILEDGQGNLWMSCNKGIFRVALRDLDALLSGSRNSITSTTYGRADGMGSRECNGGTQPVAGRTPDGRLWFATTRGVAMIDPGRERTSAAGPPISIRTMQADRSPLDPNARQTLSPGTKTVEFHYSALHFATPEKLHYQYRLSGFDEQWVDAGSRRVAYYTNLPAGDYRFHVRARIGDGPWNEASTASISFQPFFYKTGWFWSLTGAVLLMLALFAHRSRVRFIRTTAERFKLLFERNLAGVYRATAEGTLLECNDACARILGYASKEELMKQGTPPAYWNDSDRQMLLARLREHGSVSNFETSFRRADGERTWVLENVSLVSDREGRETIEATLIDITERRRAEEQIRYQAFHDGLTGLPNRALFKDRLSMALTHAQRHGRHSAVLYLDLDRFKVINDTLGHTVGDDLLQAVAQRLTTCVRQEDSVARVGGDEFILLLAELGSVTDAVAVARKILREISRPMRVDGHELYVTTSIGIAVYPSDGEDAETLLKNADTALYRAKDSGRNRYQLCSPSLTRQAAERLAVENDLRLALDRHEFIVHYQPQIDLRSGRFSAAEALLRWDRPGKGIVRPAEFIPVAEETRLILEIGEWVLERACQQARMWQSAGLPVRIAVNFSARQFQQQNLVQTVRDALERSSLDPRRLEIEITESTAMSNPDLTANTLADLKRLGIGIAIDDFGVGHSSLNYLKRFPIDAIKIDRSFVQDITHDESDAAIVSAVIAMARALKLRVIAEGVETKEQLEFLEQHGCMEMQGYLQSRPLPGEAITDLIRSRMPARDGSTPQHLPRVIPPSTTDH